MNALSEHRSHRLAHAIYGLIVLTAAVGELRALEEDFGTAAVVIAGAFVILVIAHGYSQAVANAATHEGRPTLEFMRANAIDQLAIAVPAAVAIVVLAISQTSLLSLSAAYNIVVVGAIAVLAAAGIAIGVHHGLSLGRTLGLGAANMAVGSLIVWIEALAAH